MNQRSTFLRSFLMAGALLCGVLCGSPSGFAGNGNDLFGTYDFEGRATIKVASPDLPFGLGSIDLSDTFSASGSIKLQSDRLVVQIDKPIQRREVIRLNRKLRHPKRNSFRYRKSGSTVIRGNTAEYRVVLRLRRTAGKWSGRGRVETKVTSGDLAGSSARIRGRLVQQ